MLLIVFLYIIGIEGQRNSFFNERDLDYSPVPRPRGGPVRPNPNPNYEARDDYDYSPVPRQRGNPIKPKHVPKNSPHDDYDYYDLGPPEDHPPTAYEQMLRIKNMEDNERGFGMGMYWPEDEKMPHEAMIQLAIHNLRVSTNLCNKA
ncbi:uncharacterized protein LOC123703679 [Colias croceus]|uniref:uncharacterized protein LOC123703679 n=1 Tax=Colias crocea TaxID=72248 RepID=UPI001E27F5BD|nr:uncharacterized protein LOC123703679 [Colias croceus]